MDWKLFLAFLLIMGIFAAGCTSPQMNSTAGQNSSDGNPGLQSATMLDSPPPTLAATPVPPSVAELPAVPDPGKSQYLEDVTEYLETISTDLNSIKRAKQSPVDYAVLGEASGRLYFTILQGKGSRYRGDDPDLTKIETVFEKYHENMYQAILHYNKAGNKGMQNDIPTASAEIRAGDAFYNVAMEAGQKIILELDDQGLPVSDNIQDAHGIRINEQLKVYR